ncbi:MAG: hypothetical protein WAW86_10205 [Gammaproteobacteria bacterium]
MLDPILTVCFGGTAGAYILKAVDILSLAGARLRGHDSFYQ